MNSKTITALAALVGVIFLIVAVIYWITPASGLPSFLPGHSASAHPHHKHAVLAVALAVVCFLVAWFQSGPKPNNQAV